MRLPPSIGAASLVLLLAAPSLANPIRLAQGGSASGVAQAAAQVLNVTPSNWDRAAILRLQLVKNQADLMAQEKGDLTSFLGFFSTSRAVWWTNSPTPAQASKIRDLEKTTQAFASSKGVALDLPPISSASAPQTTSAGPAAAGSWIDMVGDASAAEKLAITIRRDVNAVPNLSDDNWTRRARLDLDSLANSLTGLRVALEEQGDPRLRWGEFEASRIRFLTSYQKLPPIDERLPQLLGLLQNIPERVPGGRMRPRWP